MKGSKYFVGGELIVFDIYWVCFLQLFELMVVDKNLMNDMMCGVYIVDELFINVVKSFILMKYWDFIYDVYLKFLLDF